MDITAAIGLNQFKRLNQMIKIRSNNRKQIIDSIKNSNDWNNQIDFLDSNTKVKPSWFGMPILINKKIHKQKVKIFELFKQKWN